MVEVSSICGKADCEGCHETAGLLQLEVCSESSGVIDNVSCSRRSFGPVGTHAKTRKPMLWWVLDLDLFNNHVHRLSPPSSLGTGWLTWAFLAGYLL